MYGTTTKENDHKLLKNQYISFPAEDKFHFERKYSFSSLKGFINFVCSEAFGDGFSFKVINYSESEYIYIYVTKLKRNY